MLDEMTFGKFIAEKRAQAGYSMRAFARKLSLSPTYLSNIENEKRPAPAGNILVSIANLLKFDEKDRIDMFELAAKTKRDGTLPFDILDYINSDEDIKSFLRTSKKAQMTGKDLLALV